MAEIGATLREARMRAHIDVSEIEAQTKIRAKYLRALENEEWDLLPGPSYVTSFLRTYARALGLDSKQLLEEYRSGQERAGEPEPQPIIQGPRRNRPSEPPRRRVGVVLLLAVMGIVALLLVLDLAIGSSPKSKHPAGTGHKPPAVGVTGLHSRSTTTTTTTTTISTKPVLGGVVSLQVLPTGPVTVCLVDRAKHLLIPGLSLQAGEPEKTYRSRHFYLVLSNSNVRLRIDGTDRKVGHSTTPIGYSITRKAGRHREPVAKLPTCG